MKTSLVMKKYLKYILLGILTAMMLSCNSFMDLDPKNTYNETTAFSSIENVDLYVKSFYGLFYSVAQNNVAPEQMRDGISDLVKYSWYGVSSGLVNRFLYGNLQMNADQNFRSNWSSMYSYIRRCNEYFTDVSQYGKDLDPEQLKIRTAETRFIRAFAYQQLVVYHGGVILRISEDKVDGPNERAKACSSEEECWTFILDEYAKAAADLPDRWSAAETGRLTKGAAYGMIARAALYAKRWEKAAEACDKVLGMGYALMPGKTAAEYMRIFTQPGNSELIMASYFQQGIGMKQHRFNNFFCPPYDFKAAGISEGTIGATAAPSDEYASSFDILVNGQYTPFDWKKLASYGNKPFDNREPRFYASILYNDAEWRGRKLQLYKGGTDGYMDFAVGGQDNVHRTTTGYLFRKFLDDSKTINYSSLLSATYWTEMRLSEIYLIRSEANARMNDFKKAYADLKVVRDRVGLPELSVKNTWDEYLKDLSKERICELGLEGHRYLDLVRWDMAEKVLDHSKLHGIRISPIAGGFSYERVECDPVDRLFPRKYLVFPIPKAEIQDNTLCKQNPGW